MYWVALFFIYSVLGWGIDTLVRTLYAGKLVIGNALKPWPFAPIYGFGALILLGLSVLVQDWPVYLKGLAFGLVMAFFEGISGPFSEWAFKRRLWRYGSATSFFHGYTDAWHVVLWGILGVVLTELIQPWVDQLLSSIW